MITSVLKEDLAIATAFTTTQFPVCLSAHVCMHALCFFVVVSRSTFLLQVNLAIKNTEVFKISLSLTSFDRR